jgi:DNA-binding LacI/PurR family transcriptional regulator
MSPLPHLDLPTLSTAPNPLNEHAYARLIAGHLLDHFDHPWTIDALIAETDSLVIPIQMALRLLKIPENKQPVIAGYDGYCWMVEWMRTWIVNSGCQPAVSVQFSAHELGRALAKTMIKRLSAPDAPPMQRLVPMRLIFPPRPQ